MIEPRVLATDLDGTLIPLDDSAEHRRDLALLAEEFDGRKKSLVFVTGRHLASVLAVRREASLPRPAWILCDVGTSIYEVGEGENETIAVDTYQARLGEIVAGVGLDSLRPDLERIEGLRVQEEPRLGPFKLSFYCAARRTDEFAERVGDRLLALDVPYSVVSSVDPSGALGLIDVLPIGVNKAFALEWWREDRGLSSEEIVYAGDSGNDWDALVAGYRSILVANASPRLARRVADRHAEEGWTGRLHLARATATSGVLEGWRRFSGEA